MNPATDLRHRARSTFQSLNFRQVACLKGGNLCFDTWSLTPPGTVDPVEFIDVEIGVFNGAFAIVSTDPDRCDWAPNGAPGYEFIIHLNSNFGIDSDDIECIGLQAVGVNHQTYNYTIAAPLEPGDYWIEAWIEMAVSGETHRADRKTITVRDTDQDPTPTFDEDAVGVHTCSPRDGSFNPFEGETSSIDVTWFNDNDQRARLDADVSVGGVVVAADNGLTIPAHSNRTRSYSYGGFGSGLDPGQQDIEVDWSNVEPA